MSDVFQAHYEGLTSSVRLSVGGNEERSSVSLTQELFRLLNTSASQRINSGPGSSAPAELIQVLGSKHVCV